jgi:hypothetical protein
LYWWCSFEFLPWNDSRMIFRVAIGGQPLWFCCIECRVGSRTKHSSKHFASYPSFCASHLLPQRSILLKSNQKPKHLDRAP